MVTSSSDSPIVTLIKKNTEMAKSTSDGTRIPFGDIKSKVTVRFLMKRPTRFGEEFRSSQKRQDRENEKDKTRVKEENSCEESLRERLSYLGLTPRQHTTSESRSSSSKRKGQNPKKLDISSDDCGFIQPRVFQCDYCPKIFFNKMVYRRHTIKHLKIRRCGNCNQPFATRISQRRHQASCKRKLY